MGSKYFLIIRNKPGNETQKSYVKKQRREPLIANADEIIWNQLGKQVDLKVHLFPEYFNLTE